MCGIFGAVALQGQLDPSVAKVVQQATDQLRHRGPDGDGLFVGDRVCFGHRRLTIVDLATGSQPMHSPERDGVVTFNGEIYNHAALREELKRVGRRFDTHHSDTEVLLQAILHWGADGVQRLRGMFAFAVADFKHQRVVIARDRVGKKPLYYCIRNSVLWFSSELEPLWKAIGPFKLDRKALDQYLTWQYVPAPGTIYQDVWALPAGHVLSVDQRIGECAVKKYWSLQFREEKGLTDDEWEKALDKKLREAVEIRLMSDVPFGAFLSGGLDSSLVVGYMAELLDQPVRSFSIGFEEADHSELEYADAVAKLCRTEHETEIVKADSLGLLPTLVRHFGQPFGDSSAIPTYHVARVARRKVKMVLSGDGGDENFAGYNTYPAICSEVEGKGGGGLGHRLLSKILAPLRSLALRESPVLAAHSRSYQHFGFDQRRRLYRTSWRDAAVEDNLPERQLLLDESQPLVSRLQALDVISYLSNDILTKVDIAAMANSLEVRCPLLDHEVMELVATMPTRLKINWAPEPGFAVPSKKHVLKKLAMRRYPKDLVERPKQGFGVPLGAWFAQELRSYVSERLLRSPVLPDLFDMSEISGYIDSHGVAIDHSPRLWNLLFLDEWLQTHDQALVA